MQPQKVWVIIFFKVWKLHLMQELTCFSAFYITTLTLLYSLRLQGGAVAPLNPPLTRTGSDYFPAYCIGHGKFPLWEVSKAQFLCSAITTQGGFRNMLAATLCVNTLQLMSGWLYTSKLIIHYCSLAINVNDHTWYYA